jgi:hypothetical protein
MNIEGGIGPYEMAGVPGAGTSEVQTLTFGGTPTGGTFTIAFDGYTTEPITWVGDDDAALIAAVDAALEALPNVGAGGVTCADGTLTNGVGTITITFGGNLAKLAVPLMTVTSSLTGTLPTAAITETTPGVTADFRGAKKGAIVTDTTNGVVYVNTGTSGLNPTWTKVGTQS